MKNVAPKFLDQMLSNQNVIKLTFISQNDDNLERRESTNLRYTQSAVEVDMANGKVIRIPHASIKNKQQINITEVLIMISDIN